MYRGIRCVIPNEWGNYLCKLLDGADTEKYFWFIEDSEIYVGTEELFTQTQYIGDEFKRVISGCAYYIIYARIQGSISGGSEATIETFSDFCASDCQIYVIIIDCVFADIYVKSQTVAENIRKNAIKYGFADIGFITEENDRNLQ